MMLALSSERVKPKARRVVGTMRGVLMLTELVHEFDLSLQL